MASTNSFNAHGELKVGDNSYEVYRLDAVEGSETLPYSLKVLLENLLRTEDGANITADHIRALGAWDENADPDTEIQFTPARVLMQDFTGVPCIVDLATMREAVADLGGDPAKINPLSPAEMVIDHSVIIDVFGRADAFERNVEIEYQRNGERYQFLRWGQTAFEDFKVVPPGTGIVHQVNIEHLARTVMVRDGVAYPDTCVGTDSHTTMVNGLGVLGWGVGGIEAEAAMLGQPVSMLIPRVVGFKLSGSIPAGATATDVVLTITEQLRAHGVVGKFVEFYGEGVSAVPLANRATIGNMSPEFGSTCAIFPIDDVTLEYLRLTGRSDESVALVEAYAKEQGMWLHAGPDQPEARYSERLELDLSTVVPSIAGPKRPQDRIALTDAKESFRKVLPTYVAHHEGDAGVASSFPASDPSPQGSTDGTNGGDKPESEGNGSDRPSKKVTVTTAEGASFEIDHGIVVDRLDHQLHQHLQPVGDDGGRHAGQERRRPRPDGGPVGQDVDGAGLQGRLRLLREGRHVALPREARLPPGRLRLHHLHRQLRSAVRRDLRGHQRERPRRRLGALGQPQLRGPDQPRREDELPRVAAAGHRLRPGRHDGLRLRRPSRWVRTPTATTCSSRTCGRPRPTSSGPSPRASTRRCSPATTPTCSPATSAGSRCRRPRARPSTGPTTPPTCASPRTSTA